MSSRDSLDDVSEATSISFGDEDVDDYDEYSDVPVKKAKLQISGDYEIANESSSNDSDLVQFIESNVPTYEDHSLDYLFSSDQISKPKKVNQKKINEIIQKSKKSPNSKKSVPVPSKSEKDLQISTPNQIDKEKSDTPSDSNELTRFIEANVPVYKDYSFDNLFSSDQNSVPKKLNQQENRSVKSKKSSNTRKSLPSPSKSGKDLQISALDKANKEKSDTQSDSNDLVQFIEANVPAYKDHSFDHFFSSDQPPEKPNSKPSIDISPIIRRPTPTKTERYSLNDSDLVQFIEANVPSYQEHTLDKVFLSDHIVNETKKINQQEHMQFLQRQERSSFTKTSVPLLDEIKNENKSFVNKRSKQILKDMNGKPRNQKPIEVPKEEEKFSFHPKYQSDPKLRENAKKLVSKRKREKEKIEKSKLEQYLSSQQKQKQKSKDSPKFNRKLLSVLHKFESESDSDSD
ncbi:hypothetical protein GPJ56_003378 [Histomonas meleagridis]|uniref:uncharacterized protein n=1 Tax=Histomonas meleagridis TaxID=135588 RepID=UPI003559D4EB|nr:hypothetical protein GPJ56_003378 [Histomonas meleagridis]KAH0804997.1 hypothetical protein GO595_001942 [Histomonas meleagridis]